MTDIKTLEKLVEQMRQDCQNGRGLSSAAVLSIANIVEASIGAPLSWPTRVAGCDYADDNYPGSPAMRLAFNHGVKWAVEHYSSTEKETQRFD